MKDSGKSVPDQTSADNPSETGFPTVDSQGTDKAVKGGTVAEQRSQSDSDRNPNNHTVPYGADAKKPKIAPKQESAKQFAERGVVERHGESIRQNPDFDNMVKREQDQVEANRKATAGM